MNEKARAELKQLRSMSSEAAADWLLKTYPHTNPGYGQVIVLIGHLSWKKADQIRLAKYYLQGLPHATDRYYKTFASFMSLDAFIGIMREHIAAMQRADDKMQLLKYHLGPLLQKYRTSAGNIRAIDEFWNELD